MKKVGLVVVLCVVAGVAGLLVIQYYGRTADNTPRNTGRLKVNLPEAPKDQQGQSAALDSDIAAKLDDRLISESSKAIDDAQLAQTKDKIQSLNKPFEQIEFKEVPENFRLKMHPAETYNANGYAITYFTDEAGNIIDGTRIRDYGECTSTVAYDGEDAFRQFIEFKDPIHFIVEGTSRRDEKPKETQTYMWKANGDWTPPPGTERYMNIWPTKLDAFASRKLSKGEQVSMKVDDRYDATYEVLGYAEIEGHKTVAFEQRIPDCPMHETLGVPPFKREISRRFYLDIETSMPLRAEARVISHFTDEHRNNPILPGIPKSGIQQDVMLYQLNM